MTAEIISWIAVAFILAASIELLLSRDWRVSLTSLAVQYLAGFWLVTRHWPIGMASVKLVTGWMVITALGMTRLGASGGLDDSDEIWPRGRWFRIILAGIIVLLTASAAPRIEASIPGLGLPVISGSLIMLGIGLIHLGISSQTLRVVLSLLTVLAGCEILYAAVESSILVAGLLALTNLGLGLVGSYLLLASSPAEEQT
jgi:hypothetical protein